MDAATTQWPQGINGVVKPVEKKPRPQKEQAVHCPRCSSTNTKFCYYNNYSLSQPRYFCKTCRRYWTEGGSLRNVPVGGGSRKNKRSSSSSSCNINTSSSSSSSKKAITDNATASNFLPQNPNNKFQHGGHDLNLSYNPSQYDGMSEFIVSPSFGTVLDAKNMDPQNPITACSNASHVPVMELLKSTGNIRSMGLGSLLSAPVSDSDSSMFPSISFPWHDQFNPSLNFSLNGLADQNNGFGNMQGVDQAQGANPTRNNIFPNFGELKPVSNTDDQLEQDRVQGEDLSNGFNWNGMLAGGSW